MPAKSLKCDCRYKREVMRWAYLKASSFLNDWFFYDFTIFHITINPSSHLSKRPQSSGLQRSRDNSLECATFDDLWLHEHLHCLQNGHHIRRLPKSLWEREWLRFVNDTVSYCAQGTTRQITEILPKHKLRTCSERLQISDSTRCFIAVQTAGWWRKWLGWGLSHLLESSRWDLERWIVKWKGKEFLVSRALLRLCSASAFNSLPKFQIFYQEHCHVMRRIMFDAVQLWRTFWLIWL